MLKITKIRRSGLRLDICYDPLAGSESCCRGVGYWFSWVERINFVRDGLHYSIQLGDNEGFDLESAVEVRCKETRKLIKVLGYGTPEFMKLVFDWDWKKLGTTYKTFPVDKLEEIVFGDDKDEL